MRAFGGILLVGVVAVGAGNAHAKGKRLGPPAAKAMLDAQLAALNAYDGAAFAATFDDSAYVVFPTAAEASGKSAIEAAASTWVSGLGDVKVAAAGAKFGDIADSDCAWISTEVVVTGAASVRWRVTELVAPRQPHDNVNALDPGAAQQSDYRVLAAHWSAPISDADALAEAAGGSLPTLPTVADARDVSDQLSIGTLTKGYAVSSDPAVTMIGSAPKELSVGKAAVKSRLDSWKSLALAITEGTGGGDANSMGAASYVVAHATVTYKVKGKPVVVPYRVLLITSSPPPGAHGATTIDALHFSIAR